MLDVAGKKVTTSAYRCNNVRDRILVSVNVADLAQRLTHFRVRGQRADTAVTVEEEAAALSAVGDGTQ